MGFVGELVKQGKKAIGDTVKAGKKAVKDVTEETKRTPKNVAKLGTEALDLARNLLGQGLIPPVVREYFSYLETQASGKWKGIPSDLHSILSTYYPQVIMGNVRYAENIDTVHGMAITIDDQIFFPTSLDLYSPDSFGWLLHELEHVGQYRVAGGRDAFVAKYLLQGGMEIFTKGSFNVHDAVGLEREAIDKADRIFEAAYDKTIAHETVTLSEEVATSEAQHWRLKDLGGLFIIQNRRNDKVLDYGDMVGSNERVILFSEHPESHAQHWQLKDLGGYFIIQNRRNDKVLDYGDKIDDSHEMVILYPEHSESHAQQWSLQNVAGGYYAIKNRRTGKVLDYA